MIDEAVSSILNPAIRNIGLLALAVSTCAFIIAASRDAFDLDTSRQITPPIGGAAYQAPPWRYMSDEAQRRRDNLMFLTKLIRMVVVVVLVAAILGFTYQSMGSLFEWWAKQGAVFSKASAIVAQAWFTNSTVQAGISTVLGFTFLSAGPPIIWLLASVTTLLTNARNNPSINKIA